MGKRKKNKNQTTIPVSRPAQHPQLKIQPLPNQQSQQRQIQRQIQVTTAAYAGPVPHPEILADFENILPGAAERIFKMAEANNQFRIDSSMEGIRGDIELKKRGQICGCVVGVVALIVACILGYLGESGGTMTIGGASLCAIVVVFVTGKAYKSPKPEQQPATPAATR